MGYYVERLKRPYDYHSLIEAYIYTQRQYVHPDFGAYYRALLAALEPLFGIRLSENPSDLERSLFWTHFRATIRSLLAITYPWAGYLEAGLLVSKLRERVELNEMVNQASARIAEANRASEVAHREMLEALFLEIYGRCDRVVGSEELLRAGFDDSKEPNIVDYSDYF